MTDATGTTEETTNVVAAVTEPVTKAAEATGAVITELIEKVPMSYIVAAFVGGMILGVGLILFMDDANKKRGIVLINEDGDAEE